MLGIALSWGCASAPPEDEVLSAEVYYERALKLLEGSRKLLFFHEVDYPAATELLQEVVDSFPYSEYAILAEMKIADIYFEQEEFEEASALYQQFVELHPRHKQVPYAIYQRGQCFSAGIRDTDQDLTPAREAIAQFEVLIDRYPNSLYADEAVIHLGGLMTHLARHDIEVADFYYDRGEYHAAAVRYQRVMSTYPYHSARLQTMIRLGTVLKRMHRYDEAFTWLDQVLEERPEDLDDEIESQLAELEVDLTPLRPR